MWHAVLLIGQNKLAVHNPNTNVAGEDVIAAAGYVPQRRKKLQATRPMARYGRPGGVSLIVGQMTPSVMSSKILVRRPFSLDPLDDSTRDPRVFLLQYIETLFLLHTAKVFFD